MKLTIVSFNIDVYAGGSRLNFCLARALEKLGNKVSIFAPTVDKSVFPDLQAGLDIHEIAPAQRLSWGANPPGLVAKIRNKLRQERLRSDLANKIADSLDIDTDILILDGFSYLVAPLYRRRNIGIKILWMMHDPPYMYLPKETVAYDLSSRIYNVYKDIVARRYFKEIQSVAVVNEKNKKWAEDRGLAAHIVRPGVDFEHFYAPVKRRKAGDKSVRLLSVGAPNKYRRFEDTITAAALLRQEGYDACAKIVGKNIWNENEYCDYLKSLAKEKGVADFVEFHFEGLSDKGVADAYRESDVFILPIHLPPPRDGFGWQLSCFEAMAAGTPVVISRKNDSTEVLEDDKTALFVDPLSPEQIAAKVKRLIDNPADCYRIASVAQKFIKENMSWEKYAEEMLGALGGK